MSDYYNIYPLKHFAAIVADVMDIELPVEYEKSIPWVTDILRDHLGGTASYAHFSKR